MKFRCKRMVPLFFCWASLSLAAGADDPDRITRELAVLLANERDHQGAAIEFRRLALSRDDQMRGQYYLAAANEYLRADNVPAAQSVLERADDALLAPSPEALFLRAESSRRAGLRDEARFYYQMLLDMPESDQAYRVWSARQMAVLDLQERNPGAARQRLEESPADESQALAAVSRYSEGRDKSPRVGGLLGLIPGLGYMYSGEYANGFRSIILNSLFIYGMVATAQEDQWGGFAVITFFELTWYSGSIYGGIDAAHRHNHRRHEEALREMRGNMNWQPDFSELPLFSLRFEF